MDAAEFLQRAHHMLAGLLRVAGAADGLEMLGVICDGGEIYLVECVKTDARAWDAEAQADAWLQLLADKRPAFAVGGFRPSWPEGAECELICGMYAEAQADAWLQLRGFIMEWRPPVLGWYEWADNLAAQAGLQ